MNAHQRTHIPTAPIILRDRQERFCVLIVEGKSSRDAYLTAYDRKISSRSVTNGIDVSASKLLKRPKIQQRIAQIRAQNAAAERVSVRSITEMLIAVYDEARAAKQYAPAAQAAMGIAKMHGFLVDRHQVDVVRRPSSRPDSPDEMSEDRWLAEFAPLIEHDPGEGSGGEGSP